MKPLLKRILPDDARRRSLIADLAVLGEMAPGLLPLPIKRIIRNQKRYRAIYAALAWDHHPAPVFQVLIHAIISDLSHAQHGYPPRTPGEVYEWLPKLARSGEQSRGIRRLLQHLRRVQLSLDDLAFQACVPSPSLAQFPDHSSFRGTNARIVQPFRVTGGGVIWCPTGTYRFDSAFNPRSLLRLQVAALTFETLTVPCKVRRIGNGAGGRIEDLILVAYAERRGITAAVARKVLQLPLQGPSRPAKRLCSPLERILLALPVDLAVKVLRNTEPNLEYRALTAWAELKACDRRRATRILAISERTIRRWRSGSGRPHPLQRMAAAVAEGDLRAVLTNPYYFSVYGRPYQPRTA